MKMKFKKETKHTCVYETDEATAPVSQVYVSKFWLAMQKAAPGSDWPAVIELEVRPCSE